MSLGAALLDLLVPPKCPFCQRVLDDPRAPVCPGCQPRLPWLTGGAGEGKAGFLEGCFSPLRYQGQVRQAVHRYKFQRVRAYGRPFGALMAQCLRDNLPQGAGLVTWCPLSRERLRERGFDQARILAAEVGRQLSLPVLPTLRKIRHTRPQSELEDGQARRANALGAYALLPGAAVAGKQVVLVDDVVTSGATLSECACLLRLAGAQAVWGLTLARAGQGEREDKNNPKKVGKND